MNDRALFSVAAVFNFGVALGLVLPGSPVWALLHMTPRAPDVFLHLLALFIAIFGGVYVAVARNPAGKRPLVQLAVAGKLAVFAVVLLHFFAGTVPLQLPLLATGDFVFAILFARALKGMA